nr:MAG TPA: hypothetical protein [Caudoviricetes sp.]
MVITHHCIILIFMCPKYCHMYFLLKIKNP